MDKSFRPLGAATKSDAAFTIHEVCACVITSLFIWEVLSISLFIWEGYINFPDGLEDNINFPCNLGRY